MKKLKLSFLSGIFILISSILVTLIVCSIWILSLKNISEDIPIIFNKNIHVKREAKLEKEQVENAISLINQIRNNELEKLKKTVKEREIRAWELSSFIYKKYNGKSAKKQIEQRIIDALKYQIFDNGLGHYFIKTFNGKNILKPKTNHLVNALKGSKEGFVYSKIIHKNGYENILVYEKSFKPLGWYIGFERILSNFELDTKSKVLENLRSTFSHFMNPNIFIISINLKNKKCQGKVILYTDPAFSNHTCFSLNSSSIKGPNGKPCIKECFEKLLKKGSLLTTLIWPYRKTGKKRLIYLRLYKPYNWIIGSSAPFSFESMFPNFSNFLKNKILKHIYTISLISLALSSTLGLLLWLFLFMKIMYKPLKKDIYSVTNFFEHYAEKRKIDTEHIKIFEIEEIAESINNLLNSIENKNKEIKYLLTKYSSLAQNIPDTLFIFRKIENEFILDDINKEGKRDSVFGDIQINKTAEELFTDTPDILEAMNMVFKDSISTQFETTVKKHTIMYLLVRIYKIENQSIACLIRNITGIVKAYKTIERNRNLMGKLLNNIKTGVLVMGLNGNIVFVNSFAKELLGIENLDDGINKIKLPESIRYKFLKVLHGRDVCEGCEIEITTAKGLSKWFSIYATAMKIGNRKMIIVSFNDISQKHLKNRQLEYLSFHDSLTGLYNRRYFEEELSRLFNKRNQPLGLILIDLNGLKIVNDFLGHKTGDKLIMRSADIFSISTRASDIVARIGGDEFAIILPNTSESGIKKILSRIEEKIEKSNLRGNLLISISFGYAINNGQYKNSEDLFKAADNNLYKNKYSNSRKKILYEIIKWASSHEVSKREIDEKYLMEREEASPPRI